MKRMFWDKNISEDEVKQILKDDRNERFVYFAAILLSRNNSPKIVFGDFLEKKIFIKAWQKIKRKMRQNKWSDSRIIFWDEIYGVLKNEPEFSGIKADKKEKAIVSNGLKAIGGQIRAVRERKNLTQRELANNASVSQQTISLIERGYSNISFSTLEKIAAAMGLEIRISAHPAEMMSSPVWSSTTTTT